MSASGRRAFVEMVAARIELGLSLGRTPMEIAQSIVNKTPQNLQRSTMRKLLEECRFHPVCWVCELRIFLDESEDDYSGISLDHVVPKCEGGTRENDNIRLAHRICNSTRHYPKLKPKTRSRVEAMKQRLLERMALDVAA